MRGQIESQLEQITQLQKDVEDAKKQVDHLDKDMLSTLDDIEAAQARYAQLQESAASMAVELYKDRASYNPLFIFESSETLNQVIWRLDMREKVIAGYASKVLETREANEELQQKYQMVSREKDEQRALVKEMSRKSAELEESVAELRKREKLLSAAEQAALAQAAAAAGAIAQTFATGSVGSDDESGWVTGLASAYGGESDELTPNPGLTATGTVCDDYSVGVAVPMKWGASKYYGLRVEISYGDQSIIAPVVDCGDMDKGNRALDLQPGVFKAFGCATCDEWGVREVRYRFIEL